MQPDIPEKTERRVRTLFEAISFEIVGGNVQENLAQFNAAMVVLAATYAPVGTNASAIAKFTGIDDRTVTAVCRRLLASGLWKGSNVHYDPADEHELNIAVLVAEGLIVSTDAETKSAA